MIIDEDKLRRKSKSEMGFCGAFPSSSDGLNARGLKRVKLSPLALRAERFRIWIGYAVLLTGILAFFALMHLVLTQGASLPSSVVKATSKLNGVPQGIDVKDIDINFAPKDRSSADRE